MVAFILLVELTFFMYLVRNRLKFKVPAGKFTFISDLLESLCISVFMGYNLRVLVDQKSSGYSIPDESSIYEKLVLLFIILTIGFKILQIFYEVLVSALDLLKKRRAEKNRRKIKGKLSGKDLTSVIDAIKNNDGPEEVVAHKKSNIMKKAVLKSKVKVKSKRMKSSKKTKNKIKGKLKASNRQ